MPPLSRVCRNSVSQLPYEAQECNIRYLRNVYSYIFALLCRKADRNFGGGKGVKGKLLPSRSAIVIGEHAKRSSNCPVIVRRVSRHRSIRGGESGRSHFLLIGQHLTRLFSCPLGNSLSFSFLYARSVLDPSLLRRVGQAFDYVFSAGLDKIHQQNHQWRVGKMRTYHGHDWHARNFANTAFEILNALAKVLSELRSSQLLTSIVRRNNVDLMLHTAINDTIIGVHALMAAFKAFPAFISCDAQCDSIFGTKFF